MSGCSSSLKSSSTCSVSRFERRHFEIIGSSVAEALITQVTASSPSRSFSSSVSSAAIRWLIATTIALPPTFAAPAL